MHIGLTYDLRDEYLAAGYGAEETAEFDQIGTIDAIDDALTRLGHETDRIGHARQLVERLARGDRWELVFNICEGLRGIGREAQVPAILEVYEIPYTFADPAVTSICLHKAWTKTLVRAAGVPTPDWQLIENEDDLDGFRLPFPVLAKPVAEGTGKGIDAASKIADGAGLGQICQRLLAKFEQPVLVETFLPGREFTVGLFGGGDEASVIGTMEIVLRNSCRGRGLFVRQQRRVRPARGVSLYSGWRRYRGGGGGADCVGRVAGGRRARRRTDRSPLRRGRAAAID